MSRGDSTDFDSYSRCLTVESMRDDDWQLVRDLCQGVDLGALVDDSLLRIRAELPDYDGIPRADHRAAVELQQTNMVEVLSRRGSYASWQLAQAADLARARAHQGVGIDTLLSAYHLGHIVLWEKLTQGLNGTEALRVVPELGTLLLRSLHDVSIALSVAHGEVSLATQASRITASQRLVQLLAAGDAGPEALVQARVLGLDPEDAMFVAVVWRVDGQHADRGRQIVAAYESLGCSSVTAHVGDGSATLLQTDDPGRVRALLQGPLTPGSAGIGVARRGLEGAAASLADALLARGVTDDLHPVRSFDEVWHEVCGVRDAARLRPLVDTALGVVVTHPHLADAVSAYAAHGMQLAAAADVLHLHPNTVTYRLARWHHLTGWNPRSFDELRRSLMAIQIHELGTRA